MNTSIRLLILFFAVPLWAKLSEIDQILGDLLSQDPILETRQIELSDYPNAYNPSLIAYGDGYLLSFRYITKCPKTIGNFQRVDLSFIGLVKLDANFQPLQKSVQLLDVLSDAGDISLTAEDARLFSWGERILIFFNDVPHVQKGSHSAMYFGELVNQGEGFALAKPAKQLIYFNAKHIEKNWTPFISNDKLYLIYADEPRVILEVDEPSGLCTEIDRSDPDWKWQLGLIRGGSPAYLVDGQFLTIFHSSFPASIPKKRAFVMGAYTFDPDPPFSIRAISSQPFGELEYYTQNNAGKIVFPGGIVFSGDLIHVAWGKGDRQMFITTLSKNRLCASMRNIAKKEDTI